MNDTPLVTVALRTRNRAHYLRLAVESVLSQSCRDIDLVISDDASSDDTPHLCRELMQADPRVRVFRHDPPLGIYGNWQFCCQQGRGRYYAALDDDNLYLPGFLEKAVAALETNPQAAFVFADEWVIDAEGRRLLEQTDAASRRYARSDRPGGMQADTILAAIQQAPGINSSVFAREAVAAVGGFRELAGELADFDLFLNLAAQGGRALYLPERLIEYRLHDAQNTDTLMAREAIPQADIALLETYHFQGEAERLRRLKLVQSHLLLGRALLLNQRVPEARRVVLTAWRLAPARPKPALLLAFLCLPTALIEYALRRRYGARMDAAALRAAPVRPGGAGPA